MIRSGPKLLFEIVVYFDKQHITYPHMNTNLSSRGDNVCHSFAVNCEGNYQHSRMKFLPRGHGTSWIIIQLVVPVGNVKQVLCSYRPPEWARWAHLARSGLPTLIPRK